MIYQPDWSIITNNLGIFWEGLLLTLQISALSLLLAIPIGIIVGIGRISKNRFVNFVASAYVEIMRGIPLIVILIWIYFVLGQFLKLGSFWGSIVSLAIFSGAFIAEIVRGGIQSIPKGQMEAARSSGMTHFQAMKFIILPQAFRKTLPPMASQFILLIKDSSLVSTISAVDLTLKATNLAAISYRYIEIWSFVAVVYFAVTFTLSLIIRQFEKRLLKNEF
ncbi:amino acid ABC transporter permease [Rummeliibacillus suwonensis]|uniref:amino acid ABC transporter permease n=1 Tax=Rummeliibacillus suwonensis TaxID=1306154 RepID=UPI001AAF574D|nr:amino acid ABC transporter permease [Rummeliibacillus suwonensis]MBO2535241.1 amino acid ABC transporter permease [Rummeliibacillus suwonensis]